MKRAELLDVLESMERSLAQDPVRFERKLRGQLALAAVPFLAIVLAIAGLAAWISYTVFIERRQHHPFLDLAIVATLTLLAILYRWRSPASRDAAPALRLDRKSAPGLLDVLERARAADALLPVLTTGEKATRVESPHSLFAIGKPRLFVSLPVAMTLEATDLALLVEIEARWAVRRETRTLFLAERLMAGWSVWRDSRSTKWSRGSFGAEWMPRVAGARLAAFVLARRARREVEREVRTRAGDREVVGAFARADAAVRWLEEGFYRHVTKQAQRSAEPPRTIFASLARQLDDADRCDGRWIDEAFVAASDPTDMTPSVSSLAADAHVSRDAILATNPVAPSAARAWFGGALEALARDASAVWFRSIAFRWRVRHERARAMASMCATLEARADNVSPDDERLRVLLVLETRGPEAALPFARAAHERDPRDVKAESLLAVCLLETGDERGLAHAERAVHIEPVATRTVSGPAYLFCVRAGRAAEARRWRELRSARQWSESLAAAERVEITPSSALEPHGLQGQEVVGVLRVLASLPWIHDAYLVKRTVEYLRDEPNWLLVVIARQGWLGDDPEPQDLVAHHISLRLDDLQRDITVRSAASIPRWLEKKLVAIAGGSLPVERARQAREGKAAWPARTEEVNAFLAPRKPTRPPVRLSFVAAVALVLVATAIVTSSRWDLARYTPNRAAVLSGRIGSMQQGSFPAITAHGRVVRTRSVRDLANGAQCEVEIAPAPTSSESFNCQVTVRCGGQRTIYDGFMQCALEHGRPVRALDPFGNSFDGDPAIEFDAAGHRVFVDDGAPGPAGRLVVIELAE